MSRRLQASCDVAQYSVDISAPLLLLYDYCTETAIASIVRLSVLVELNDIPS